MNTVKGLIAILADSSMWLENGDGMQEWRGAGECADPIGMAQEAESLLQQDAIDNADGVGSDFDTALSYLAGVQLLARRQAKEAEALIVRLPLRLAGAMQTVFDRLDHLVRENADRQDDTHIAQAEATALRDMPSRLENAELEVEGLRTRLQLTEEHAERLEAKVAMMRAALGEAEGWFPAHLPGRVRQQVARACEDGAGVDGQMVLLATLDLVRSLDPKSYLRKRWEPLRRLVAALAEAGFEVGP